MGVSRKDVIKYNLLDSRVVASIPEVCPVCGSEIEFTDSLKQIYCVNKECSLKVAARLEAMAKLMKADGWGSSTCLDVVQFYRLKTPYQIFSIGERVDELRLPPNVSAFRKKLDNICDKNKRRVKLWELVRLAGIPSIETIAYKIFDGYSNLRDAYKDIELYEVPFIANKLGIKNMETGVMAVNIYNTLLEYKEELLYGENKFEIYSPEGDKLLIAITGGVEDFNNKGEFIEYINSRYIGKVNVVLMNSVNSKLDVLVADNDKTSNKYKTACRLKEKGSKIIITSSKELMSLLDEKYKK